MTRSEWGQIAAGLVAKWSRFPLPDAALAQFFDDLRDLDADHVAAAVTVLYREGREFPPNGAQIRAKVIELAVDAPDWADTRRELARCFAFGEQVMRGGEWCNPRAERLARCHDAIRTFVDLVGWQEIAACSIDDRVGEAQLRTKYERHVARHARDSALLGMAPAGLPALERINGRSGLRKLAPITRQIEGGSRAE